MVLVELPVWALILMIFCTGISPGLMVLIVWITRTDQTHALRAEKMDSLAQHATESLLSRFPYSVLRDLILVWTDYQATCGDQF